MVYKVTLFKYNTMDVREDVIKMVSGYDVDIIINEEFRAGQEPPKTKIEIYSVKNLLKSIKMHYWLQYVMIRKRKIIAAE